MMNMENIQDEEYDFSQKYGTLDYFFLLLAILIILAGFIGFDKYGNEPLIIKDKIEKVKEQKQNGKIDIVKKLKMIKKETGIEKL